MSLKLIERVLFGPGAAQRRRDIDIEITKERANLIHQQNELDASVRQNQQVLNSAGRVIQTMTHAMAMMEARRGKIEG